MPAAGQIPNTLLHSIPAPPTTQQAGAELGYSVAVDGAYAVAGAPFDDMSRSDAGVVKVFDSTTGALLHIISNPTPGLYDYFGIAVAISGTKVVIGAYEDDVGAMNAGSAYVYDLASPTPTVPVLTLNNPGPATQDYFGQTVAIAGNRVVVSASRDDTGGTDAGSVYVYDLAGATPSVPVSILNNPGAPDGDYFGSSVAIAGTLIVIGAYRDDTGATDAGIAYVFDLDGASPTIPIVTMANPSPFSTDEFGRSVAIAGTTVVVGAWQDDTGVTNAGSIYVYNLGSATPHVPAMTLNNPSPANGDLFGYAVALSGSRLVVSTHRDDVGATDAGSAYVYDLASATPTVPVTTLNNPSPAIIDYYGFAVAIAANRVIVGAYHDDTGGRDAGSAYVYDLTSATPGTPVATLSHLGAAADDQFGVSVAVSGSKVVVGAHFNDSGAAEAGRAYVYDLTSATPAIPAITLNNPTPSSDEFFGISVAISGARVVVGNNSASTAASTVYVYDLSNATPAVPVITLSDPIAAAGDGFGRSVAISGTRVVIGAFGNDNGASNAGCAYVYDLGGATPTTPAVTLYNPSPAVVDSFGWSVAISGTRVVVGAYQDDTGANDTGSAYVYDLSSGTPTVPVAALNNPGSPAGDYFGWSVAISGTRVVVGAIQSDTGAGSAGNACVYDLSSGTPTVPVFTLNNPSPASSDQFGNSVCISGTRVVIGAHQDLPLDWGSVYVYDLTSGAPTVPVATLSNPSPAAGERFGGSVAIDGTTVAIGTPYEDVTATDHGAAYIYGPIDGDSDGLRDAWEITHFGTQYGHGPLDDTDHDGYEELLELGLGLNPTLTNPGGIPGVTEEGGYLTMTITKQPGVTYEVQTAGTLVPAQPDSFSAASTTVLINNATTLKARDNFLISSGARRFIRVQVTAAP